MKRVVGIGLLASAFAPLVALLAVLKLTDFGWVSWVILGASAAAVLLLAVVLRSLAKVQSRVVETTSVRRADERVLAFTSSYVVPLVVALFGGARGPAVAATWALVVLLVVIYVRAGLYHLNPALAVFGFRLYEVTATNGTVTMLLAKRNHIPQRGPLECRYLGDDVAIQLKGRT
ncbi:hypothetical protein [Mycobacterium szulgai]|uniref:Uncharacterized protein n=1 Tax=Mycobacterium szulgai TaxID=1787 RepID=A0A1X2F6X9_MYCSZ|nr:hypothetical protein [Mycobacterium szulgai]MCV7078717.1 hypothetical protein [Mycobacterium szulgai]ORX14175.1 hypothetical protein AWC27_19755 [Mycobacterium szulgai]